jgi:hypothetical membrane protein
VAGEAPPPVGELGERYGPLVHRSVHHGALLWLVGVLQFIAAMIVTQLGWTSSYSLSQNYISDLGAVHCGPFDGRYVCSPWYELFNVSIILLGLLIILGALLLRTAFPARGSRTVGLGLLVVAGLGSIGVGVFPEDVNLTAHTISATCAFVGANLALIVLGLAMFRDTRWQGYRAFSVLCGLVGFVALFLYAGKAYQWGGFWADWGVGGMERTIVAPVLLWALLASVHLLRIRSYAPRLVPGGHSA